jgi:hypothetical protein
MRAGFWPHAPKTSFSPSPPPMQIQEKPPAATPFEWIGGEERVKALTERFYDLMALEPGYAA